MPFQSEGLFALPSRKGVKGWRAEQKKRVFQALVPKSLALRGMERIVGINRMLGVREGGRERERERERRERERELLLVPPEKMSWHLFCAYLGGQSLAWAGGHFWPH